MPATESFEIGGFGLDRFRDRRVVEHVPLFDQYALPQLGFAEVTDQA